MTVLQGELDEKMKQLSNTEESMKLVSGNLMKERDELDADLLATRRKINDLQEEYSHLQFVI